MNPDGRRTTRLSRTRWETRFDNEPHIFQKQKKIEPFRRANPAEKGKARVDWFPGNSLVGILRPMRAAVTVNSTRHGRWVAGKTAQACANLWFQLCQSPCVGLAPTKTLRFGNSGPNVASHILLLPVFILPFPLPTSTPLSARYNILGSLTGAATLVIRRSNRRPRRGPKSNQL